MSPPAAPFAKPATQRYWASKEWILEHAGELVSAYPDQWIAVLDKAVVAAGPEAGRVKEQARARSPEGDYVMMLMEATPRVYSG